MYSFHDIAFYSGEPWHFCYAPWMLPREMVDGRVVNRIFHEACPPCTVWAMYGLDASAVDPAAYSDLPPSVPSLIEDMAWCVCHGVRSEKRRDVKTGV